MKKSKQKLGKPTIATEGALRYYCSVQTVVFLQTPIARVKLCRIIFGSDGSIYVDFPYLTAHKGVLNEISLPETSERNVTLNLRAGGVLVDTHVKYSHHQSGLVHFSKTGHQGGRLPERISFPLNGPIGEIFETHVYWIHGLRELDQFKKTDMHIGFRFGDTAATCFAVRAEWRRKSDVIASRADPRDSVGPESNAVHRPSNSPMYFKFLGQPGNLPNGDHILLLSAQPIAPADGAEVPTITFFGGWNSHETTADAPNVRRHTCLAFMYPVDGPDE